MQRFLALIDRLCLDESISGRSMRHRARNITSVAAAGTAAHGSTERPKKWVSTEILIISRVLNRVEACY